MLEGDRNIRFSAADMDVQPRRLQQQLLAWSGQTQQDFTKTDDAAAHGRNYETRP
jgi:hypothetical protein